MIDYLRAEVVLCGGGARTPYITRLARDVFNLPAAIGRSSTVSGIKNALDEPEFATPVGLIKFGAFQSQTTPRREGFGRVISKTICVTLRREKMTENQKTFSGGEPVIRLIGLGETGVKLVETLAMIGPEGVESHSLDTDNRSLSLSPIQDAAAGQAIPCGLGTGGDVALARAAVESDCDRLAKLVEGANLVFVIAGMGGGTGTGAASLVARLAKESGALVVGVAATPFDCEGTRRCNQATGGLRDLKQASDVVFHFQIRTSCR